MIISTVIDFTKNYSVNFYHHIVNARVFCTVTGLQFNTLHRCYKAYQIKYEMERTCYVHKRYEK